MRKSFFLDVRSRWVGFPGAVLMVLLQRAPAINLTIAAEQLALRAPVGALLKSAIAGLAALGTVNTLVGATPLVPNVGSATGITVTVGTPVSVFYTVNGTLATPMSWTINGSFPPGLNFSGRTSNGIVNIGTLNLSGTPTTAGVYQLTIFAHQLASGTGTQSPEYPYTITVNPGTPANAPPAFTQHPAGQTVTAGSSVTFSAAASGTPAPAFQWRRGGANIGGATGGSFTIASVATGDAGDYTVVATNSEGAVTSNVATLTVNAALASPSFSQHPAGQTVTVGQSVTFSASASGNPAPTFQWRKGGADIGGATSGSFTIPSAAPGDAGDYTVVASNSQGSATSNPATLAVNAGKATPTITWAPSRLVPMGTPLDGSRLNAVANIAGVMVYDPPSGTILTAGPHVVTASFTPADTASYSNASLSLTFIVLLGRPSTFDANGYLLNNPDIAAFIGNAPDRLDQAWAHYFQTGVLEARTDGDFDVRAYLAQYPALAAQFGTDLQAAAAHWYTVGRVQGLRIPTGFDVVAYLARHLDIYALFKDDKYGAWLHFFNYGLNEGRDFDANFVVDEYLELNPDIKAAFGTNRQAALLHWFQYGHPIEDRMGRVPIGFDVDKYLARYPDLAAVLGGITPRAVRNVTTWHQYLAFGVLESRSDGDFEANAYLASNPDLAAVYGTDVRGAALHWFFYGRREGRRIPALFDVRAYRTRYPDIVVIFGDDLYGSWLHYLDWGIPEGRIFDQLFRPDEYIALNPDLAPLIGNDHELAVLHWLHFGKAAGRPGRF